MCHLILLLPLLALPLFWVFTLAIALPAYGTVLVVSGGVYYLAIRAMQRPVQTGMEALLHSTGNVIGTQGKVFQVRVSSEVWSAESMDILRPGDCVEIIAVDELRLKVRRITCQGSVQDGALRGRRA